MRALLLLSICRCAVAQQHCRAPPPSSSLLEGFSLAFASPVSRTVVVQGNAIELQQVAAAVERQHKQWSSDATAACPDDVDGADDNDRFFMEQRRKFEAGEPSFLEEDGAPTTATLLKWREAWLLAVRRYLSNALGPDGQVGDLRLFAWAAVHSDCVAHPSHVHPEAVRSPRTLSLCARPTDYSLRVSHAGSWSAESST